MTGTFWDTIVVCTITGLCIASSGVLGITEANIAGTYQVYQDKVVITASTIEKQEPANAEYTYQISQNQLILTDTNQEKQTFTAKDGQSSIAGIWNDAAGNEYVFEKDGTYQYNSLVMGASLTIAAFETALGKLGAILVSIGIALFAFSTILGWEYHGEKAFEYILDTHKFNMVYRVFFSLIVYFGATTTLEIVWSFSDIANALMAIPNLICLLALSGVIAKDVEEFQKEIDGKKALK